MRALQGQRGAIVRAAEGWPLSPSNPSFISAHDRFLSEPCPKRPRGHYVAQGETACRFCGKPEVRTQPEESVGCPACCEEIPGDGWSSHWAQHEQDGTT